MPWFNADDKMHSHPKSRAAGLEAMGLWLLAGTYCTDYLTDGYVPDYYVESWPRGKTLAQRLITATYWETADGGYRFLSWDEYQRTKDKVLEDREKSRKRLAEWRARQHPK